MQIIDPIHEIEKPDPLNKPKEKQEPPTSNIGQSPNDVVIATTPSLSPQNPTLIIDNNEPQNSHFLFLNYLITLFAAIGSLFSLAFISYGILDSWFNGEEASTIGGVLYATAGLVITVPLFIFVAKKLLSDTTDQSQSGVWPVGASHAFLAFGIIALISTATGLATWLLFVIFELIGGTSSLAGKDIALTLIGIAQAVLWLLFGAKLLLGLRKAGQQINLVLSIFGSVAILITLLAFVFPVRLDRNIKIDARTVGDLTAIQTAISNRGTLPGNLKDLKGIKDEGVESRLNQYTYKKKSTSEYELCAEFKTDTKEDDSGSPGILPLAGLGANYSDYSRFYGDDNFNKHKKGQECFKLSVYGYGATDDYSADSESDSLDSSMYDDEYDDHILSEDQDESSSTLRSN